MDHFVCRSFCILLVIVIFSAFTVEGAVVEYGVACADGGNTCNTGMTCTGGFCACATTHYTNNDNDGCVEKVVIDETCDNAVTATDQCAVTNQVCSLESGSTYKCQCTSAYYSDGSSACVTKVVIDETCDNAVTATNQCAVTNQVCSLESGSTYKCQCTSAYYSDGSSACVTKVAIDGTCDNAVTATDQCAVTNQVCSLESGSTYKCQCTPAYYSDGSSACVTKVAIDGTCDNAVTATDQCAVTNQVCSLESGSTYKCQCTSAYYSDGSSACVTKVVIDGTCDNTVTATDQCAIANQECSLESGSTYKCQCTAAYYSDGSANCVTRIKPNIACTAAGQCVTNAECDNADTDTCLCNAGYTATPTTTPTMCSKNGVVKFSTLPYMYVVPILVSMMSLLR